MTLPEALTVHVATGRGWPERLAAEVGRVIRESNNSPARVGEE